MCKCLLILQYLNDKKYIIYLEYLVYNKGD